MEKKFKDINDSQIIKELKRFIRLKGTYVSMASGADCITWIIPKREALFRLNKLEYEVLPEVEMRYCIDDFCLFLYKV